MIGGHRPAALAGWMASRPTWPPEPRSRGRKNLQGILATLAKPSYSMPSALTSQPRAVSAMGSEDAATKWAHRRLKEKNKLNAADAKHVEEAFRAKLFSFAIHAEGSSTAEGLRNKRKSQSAAQSVDKSSLTPPEPRAAESATN